jgi:hypothetical protein
MRQVGIGTLVLAVLATPLALPIEVPYTIEGPGKIVPRREWMLVRGEEGQLVSALRDHLKGSVEQFAVAGFERGDQGTFEQHPRIRAGASVAPGDTIGRFYSEELRRRWVELKGELAGELAAIAVYETGQKEPAVQAARLELAYNRAQRDWRERQVERLRDLWLRQAIADVEFEEAEQALTLQQLQVEIAQARLWAMETGAKSEELDWRKARSAALREELEVLEERLENSVLLAPIGGKVFAPGASDTLVVICDIAAYVVLLPIRWKERVHIALDQPVEMRIEGAEQSFSGAIVQLGETAFSVAGQQFFLVKAFIQDSSGLLAPELVVRGAIVAAAVSPWEFIRRLLQA